jgi:copper chaperone CopZ
MNMQVFTVKGMSCEHCVRAVTDEITSLPGVERVDVDLAAGTATVVADRELGESEVAAAVEEAGYELVRNASDQHT